MSNTDFNFDDGMNDAERAYFSGRGDLSDDHAKELGTPFGGGPLGSQQEPPQPAPQQIEQQTPPAGTNGTQPHEEDPGDEIIAGQPNPRRVSFRKYQEEQNRARDLERQLNERAVAQARIEERLSLLQQAMQPEPQQTQQEPADERPDPTQDIFAYAAWQERQLNKVIEKVNGYEQQITAGQAQMDEERNYFDSLNEYAGSEPNFVQAYNFLLRSRAAELMAADHPNATFEQLMQARIPPNVAQMIREEERDLYRNSFAGKRNPGADIFRMAQLRGWRAPVQAQPAANGAAAGPSASNGAAAPQQQRPGTALGAAPAQAAQPGNGAAAPAARPGNGAQPTATDLVEAIRRGQPAAQSLSNASGNAAGTELTPEALANMSDAEFEVLFNALQASGDKDKMRQLFGH